MNKLDLVRLHLEAEGYHCNTNSVMSTQSPSQRGNHVRVYKGWWAWFLSLIVDNTPVVVVTEHWVPTLVGEDEVTQDAKVQLSLYKSWRECFSDITRNVTAFSVDLHHPESLSNMSDYVGRHFRGEDLHELVLGGKL